jgi:quinol-cytochrome oxidoreductase complex cytochrome b subunit
VPRRAQAPCGSRSSGGAVVGWDGGDGFWASVVGMKIGSYSPFIGGFTINFLLGGDVVGPATLSRFFAIHVWLLPAAIAPFIDPILGPPTGRPSTLSR